MEVRDRKGHSLFSYNRAPFWLRPGVAATPTRCEQSLYKTVVTNPLAMLGGRQAVARTYNRVGVACGENSRHEVQPARSTKYAAPY